MTREQDAIEQEQETRERAERIDRLTRRYRQEKGLTRLDARREAVKKVVPWEER